MSSTDGIVIVRVVFEAGLLYLKVADYAEAVKKNK
jgi:hypothetical protein